MASLMPSVVTPVLTCQPSAVLTLANPIQLADPSLAHYPIATGLTSPRHLLVDTANNLLVVESGVGVMALTESAECQGWEQRRLIDETALNTGIALSGTMLYVSSEDQLWAWTYNSTAMAVSDRRTLVTGMGGSSHGTRTIVLEPGDNPSYVIMGRGSDGNLDLQADAQNRAQIRRFPLSSPGTPYDWTQGELLASGIRNAVGMAITPDARQLYIVENSADNLATPAGQRVSDTNPAEDVNVIDLLSPSRFYGYPSCYTVWDGSVFPDAKATGSQFSIDAAVSDAQCEATSTRPRLSLPAHYAPLDLKFFTTLNSTLTPSATSFNPNWLNSAFVASHGSWNSPTPVGYALLRIPFTSSSTFEPVAAADSQQGFETVFAPPDLSACPAGCFRPVGIALERDRGAQNGLFVTSDSTGEVIRLYRGAPIATRSGARRMRASTAIVAVVASLFVLAQLGAALGI